MKIKPVTLQLALLGLVILGLVYAVVATNYRIHNTNDLLGAIKRSTPTQTTVSIAFNPAPSEGATVRTEEEIQRVLQGDVYVVELSQPGRLYWQTDETTYITRGTQPGSYHATRWANKALYFGEDSLTQWRKNGTTTLTFKHRDWHSSTLLFFPESGGVWTIQFPKDWNPDGETRQLTATIY